MINKFIGIGNLGSDPEIRYSQAGTAVASFSIACTEKWKDKQGQAQEQTEWVKCTAFARLGEICGEYLSRGSRVYVEGRLKTDQWEDQNGQKRYSTGVILREMKMLSPRGEQGGTGGGGNTGGFEEPPPMADDVPF